MEGQGIEAVTQDPAESDDTPEMPHNTFTQDLLDLKYPPMNVPDELALDDLDLDEDNLEARGKQIIQDIIERSNSGGRRRRADRSEA